MKIGKTVFLAVLLAVGLACGYSSHNTTPVAGTMPNITLLNPDNANANTTFTLSITGTGFNSNAVVNFNGTHTPSAVTSTQITVDIPNTSVMTAGTVQVSVTNPGTMGTGGGGYGGGGGGTLPETSPNMPFTVN
jgi:hypothetical protein